MHWPTSVVVASFFQRARLIPPGDGASYHNHTPQKSATENGYHLENATSKWSMTHEIRLFTYYPPLIKHGLLEKPSFTLQ